MQTFAHIVDGVVREVVSIPDDLVLGEDLYASDFAAECVSCGSSVVAGMLYDAEKKKFSPAPAPTPAPQPSVTPDGPTLGDWRVGLLLWKTETSNRRDELDKKVADLAETGNLMAEIAKERSQFSNNVLRAQLLLLKDALGFTEADVDESLWRAHQVSLGDISGVWPLPAA